LVGDVAAGLGIKVETESQTTEQTDGNNDSCCQCVISSEREVYFPALFETGSFFPEPIIIFLKC